MSSGQVGQQLRMALFGAKAGIFKKDGEDYDINIRFNENDRYSESALYNQNLTFKDPSTGRTKSIPISTLTTKKSTTTFSKIKHKNFNRVVTVYSGLSPGYTDAGAIVRQIENEMSGFSEDLSGVNIDYTGQLRNKIKIRNS